MMLTVVGILALGGLIFWVLAGVLVTFAFRTRDYRAAALYVSVAISSLGAGSVLFLVNAILLGGMK